MHVGVVNRMKRIGAQKRGWQRLSRSSLGVLFGVCGMGAKASGVDQDFAETFSNPVD